MNKVFLTGIVSEPPAKLTLLHGRSQTMFHLCVRHKTRRGCVKRELYPINTWNELARWTYENLSQGQRVSLQGYLIQYPAPNGVYPARIEVTACEILAERGGKYLHEY